MVEATVQSEVSPLETPKEQPEEQADAVCEDAVVCGAGEHQVYLNVLSGYEEAKKKRNSYKTYGPLVVIITGILFLTLMFTLENKITFLILWVVTDLYTVALMIRAEYRYHQFQEMLGLTGTKDENIAAEEEEVT